MLGEIGILRNATSYEIKSTIIEISDVFVGFRNWKPRVTVIIQILLIIVFAC